jgi:hypothetical protein
MVSEMIDRLVPLTGGRYMSLFEACVDPRSDDRPSDNLVLPVGLFDNSGVWKSSQSKAARRLIEAGLSGLVSRDCASRQ